VRGIKMADDESIEDLAEEQPKDNSPSKRTVAEFVGGGIAGGTLTTLIAGYYLHPKCVDPEKDALSYILTCLLISKPLLLSAGALSGFITVGVAKGAGFVYHKIDEHNQNKQYIPLAIYVTTGTDEKVISYLENEVEHGLRDVNPEDLITGKTALIEVKMAKKDLENIFDCKMKKIKGEYVFVTNPTAPESLSEYIRDMRTNYQVKMI
jgi:hypothetical protein